MFRYLRLYAHFIRFAIGRTFEFRVDFFFRIVMDTVYYAVNIGFYKIIFLHTASVGGWQEPQTMVFVSAYLLVDAISMTVLSSNMWMLPIFVNKGDLDYYLVRPVSSLFFLSLREFSLNSFVNFLFAVGIAIWAFLRLPQDVGLIDIGLFCAGVTLGTFIYYTIHMFFLIPVFWTHSQRGFGELFHPATRLMERPDTIYRGWTRRILVSVVPFALVASFPTRMVLEPSERWSLVLHSVLVAVVLFIAMLLFWRRALRQYSSASS